MDEKFDFDDLLIPPAILTDIDSRKEINIFYEDGNLPLFTAPMDTVIDYKNKKYFKKNKIIPITPRTEKKFDNDEWVAFGLNEFEKLINEKEQPKYKILVDVANGHMRKLYDLTKKMKEKHPDITLMIGNIANPQTYRLYSELGVGYIRLGIGNGGGCITTEQTGIGYPMASLIKECHNIACILDNPAKIVADGGFKKYSDIIKALGLGADYVMLGSILNKALESCADTYKANIKHDNWTEPGELINQYDEDIQFMFKNGTKFFKKFRGMSTKEAQQALGNEVLKTSEGITRMNQVEYTLSGWVENFKHYLSSHMSYVNKTNLKEFIGEDEYILITQNAFKRFNK